MALSVQLTYNNPDPDWGRPSRDNTLHSSLNKGLGTMDSWSRSTRGSKGLSVCLQINGSKPVAQISQCSVFVDVGWMVSRIILHRCRTNDLRLLWQDYARNVFCSWRVCLRQQIWGFRDKWSVSRSQSLWVVLQCLYPMTLNWPGTAPFSP